MTLTQVFSLPLFSPLQAPLKACPSLPSHKMLGLLQSRLAPSPLSSSSKLSLDTPDPSRADRLDTCRRPPSQFRLTLSVSEPHSLLDPWFLFWFSPRHHTNQKVMTPTHKPMVVGSNIIFQVADTSSTQQSRPGTLAPPGPGCSLIPSNEKVLVTQLCPTLCDPMKPTKLLCPWDFSGKNTGVGCHSLLQGILSTQGSKLCFLCLLHCRWFFAI